MTEVAMQFAAIYAQKTGYQYGLQIVAGPGSPAPDSEAYALPVDDQGNATAQPTLCKITMTPAGLARDPEAILQTIAHETFHCFQYDFVPAIWWDKKKFNNWVTQGTAEWAAFKVTRAAWKYALPFRDYLDTCEKRSLYSRTEDAVAFFGHSDDSAGDFWRRIRPTVLQSFEWGNNAAYDTAWGSEEIFLDTWASSALIDPEYGLVWTSSTPVQPPPGAGCRPEMVIGDAAVKTAPLTVDLWEILGPADATRPVMHVRIERGHARISDASLVEQVVTDSWFCVHGVCECPAGSDGTPPPAPRLVLPAVLGLTGRCRARSSRPLGLAAPRTPSLPAAPSPRYR